MCAPEASVRSDSLSGCEAITVSFLGDDQRLRRWLLPHKWADPGCPPAFLRLLFPGSLTRPLLSALDPTVPAILGFGHPPGAVSSGTIASRQIRTLSRQYR